MSSKDYHRSWLSKSLATTTGLLSLMVMKGGRVCGSFFQRHATLMPNPASARSIEWRLRHTSFGSAVMALSKSESPSDV